MAQPQLWAEASRRLLDFTQERLPEMDRFGLDVQVLSLNFPGIQAEPEAAVAVRAALAVNDLLASVIGDHPDRFRGFAALPLQDPAAADELKRAVTQLGLVGGLVNAHTNGKYVDDPDFSVVWERAAGLGYRSTSTRRTVWTRPTCCPATPSWWARCEFRPGGSNHRLRLGDSWMPGCGVST